MHPALHLTALVTSSALTAWLVVEARASEAAPSALVAAPPASVLELAELETVRNELAELRAELRTLRVTPATGAVRVAVESPVEDGEVERIVRELVAAEALAVPEEPESWPGESSDAAGGIRAILEAGIDGEVAADMWGRAAEAGQLHALLEAMERELAQVPESADKHLDRARAYYAAARAMPWNTDGNWWVDSDEAYAHALELDPEHWDARYNKARNMAFWPVAYGGQAEAIRHFETLVEQQRTRPVESRFVKSYLWLGNLYDQQGRTEAARETWLRGQAIFPDDASLAKKLASLND